MDGLPCLPGYSTFTKVGGSAADKNLKLFQSKAHEKDSLSSTLMYAESLGQWTKYDEKLGGWRTLCALPGMESLDQPFLVVKHEAEVQDDAEKRKRKNRPARPAPPPFLKDISKEEWKKMCKWNKEAKAWEFSMNGPGVFQKNGPGKVAVCPPRPELEFKPAFKGPLPISFDLEVGKEEDRTEKVGGGPGKFGPQPAPMVGGFKGPLPMSFDPEVGIEEDRTEKVGGSAADKNLKLFQSKAHEKDSLSSTLMYAESLGQWTKYDEKLGGWRTLCALPGMESLDQPFLVVKHEAEVQDDAEKRKRKNRPARPAPPPFLKDISKEEWKKMCKWNKEAKAWEFSMNGPGVFQKNGPGKVAVCPPRPELEFKPAFKGPLPMSFDPEVGIEEKRTEKVGGPPQASLSDAQAGALIPKEWLRK